MNEFEFDLIDRIEKIKDINKKYDLENKAYISFSGGKDSTILHYLIDLALPNNKIPRLFINTGIEYKMMLDFVKDMQKKDNRIIIYNSGVNLKQMLNKYGYPFKSKQDSHNLSIYQNNIELCDKYKNDKTLNEIKELLKTQEKIENQEYVDYVNNIPNGANSFVKYWYGIRVKKNEICREREYIYKFASCP